MLMLIIPRAQGQFASGVQDYQPAPGQYTNAEFIGTPAASASLINTNRGIVCLGAFGGSVTLKFSSAIKNDPSNPYGVDFTIFGNPTPTWSEPGIVQVMKDENQNGLADDTWYEIAGSDHYWNTTTPGYEVTYFNSGLSSAVDIRWQDNQGKTGVIPENSYHRQSYYPQSSLFPHVPIDQYTLKGTRLQGQIDLSIPGQVNSYPRSFGYADNTRVLSFSDQLPDNPYTPVIEGSGGDAIDIGWAIDLQGKHILLDEIHFIRIYTGMNALVGWLGEISTEITGIRDVEPAATSGTGTMVVIQDFVSKIMVGQQVSLQALVFESGIKVEQASINWSVSNTELAVVENGRLKALKNGTFKLRASQAGNPAVYSEKEIEVYSAGKAIISMPTKVVKVNDKLELSGKLTDQNGTVLSGITPKWRVDNTVVATVVQLNGSSFLKGIKPGSCWLYLESEEIASIRDSVQIQVLAETSQKKVFIAVKTSEKTLMARHSVWVETMDLTSKVDRPQQTYPLTDTSFASLADAVAAVFKDTEFAEEWAFRDDVEGGSALYLWRVPEQDEGSMTYHFGYGGSRTSDSFRKTWVVLLNQQSYVTGLNKVRINNNDEILIYHIADHQTPWQVTHLTTNSDSLAVNQTLDLRLMKYLCSMNQDRSVAVNSSEPIAGQTVQINLQGTTSSRETYITDEFGQLAVGFTKAGEYGLIAGTDLSKLWVKMATGSEMSFTDVQAILVYPNPFTDEISLSSAQPVQWAQIIDLRGKVVYQEQYPSARIHLKHLPRGFYILKAKAGNLVSQQKIIKQ